MVYLLNQFLYECPEMKYVVANAYTNHEVGNGVQ